MSKKSNYYAEAADDFAMAAELLARDKGLTHLINYSELKKVVVGDCLFHGVKPVIKLAEFKTKVLSCSDDMEDLNPMIEYEYMALYYNPDRKVYIYAHHKRKVKVVDDSPAEFDKKIPKEKLSVVYYFNKHKHSVFNLPEEEMYTKLSEVCEKHEAVMTAKHQAEAKKAAKKAEKARLLKEKTKEKYADRIKNETGDYVENWNGVVL